MHRKLITLSDGDSFAVEDVKAQAKKVIDTILKNNRFPREKVKALFELQKSVLSNSQIDCLKESNSDAVSWNKIIKLGTGNHCWFDDFHHGLVVSYFHRLILDKIKYFDLRADPYKRIKQQALTKFIRECWPKKNGFKIEQILMGMLWGNKIDFVPPVISMEKVMLTDDRESFMQFLVRKKLSRIDIIADNAGEELFYDILLINYLFVHNLVGMVRYHVKNYPYNISDSTKQDVFWALDFLVKTKDRALRTMAEKILDLLSKRQIEIVTYPFTTLGLDCRMAINVIDKQYTGSSLIITKGDFNYRKNLGWRYWDIEDRYDEIISYLRFPLACFRTIKNEILVGSENKILVEILNKDDPNWWKKGKGGVIIFSVPLNNSYLKCSTIENYWAQTL